jgi:PAS domain S-box-containing protein
MLQVANEQKSAIKYSEHLWKFALEGNGDGIWQYDINSGAGLYFPPFKKALGYSIDESFDYGMWKASLHPEDIEKIDTAFEDYLKGESRLFIVEHRLQHKTGTINILSPAVLSWTGTSAGCL